MLLFPHLYRFAMFISDYASFNIDLLPTDSLGDYIYPQIAKEKGTKAFTFHHRVKSFFFFLFYLIKKTNFWDGKTERTEIK